ncbi:LytTR family DNA-binding domain-containing protein [Streptococcus sp. FT1-106]|uniref:LytTR family DNA-binding domain-containing protein n=1 Tax=Streptococcus sp. FT1-106 TaxID=3409994 RepID=UPI003BF49113
MKLRLEQISAGEDEVIIRYREMTAQIEQLVDLVSQDQAKMLGITENGQSYVCVDDIFYVESIDSRTFAYTDKGGYQVTASLGQLAEQYKKRGFFRCTKAMVVNIYKIQFFKNQAYGRMKQHWKMTKKLLFRVNT